MAQKIISEEIPITRNEYITIDKLENGEYSSINWMYRRDMDSKYKREGIIFSMDFWNNCSEILTDTDINYLMDSYLRMLLNFKNYKLSRIEEQNKLSMEK